MLGGPEAVDKTEQIAHAYLLARGYGSARFEPDGNTPPDFLVEERIAVEVRRLNQHEHTAAGPKGIEGAHFVVGPLLRKLALELGPARDAESWFVSMHFARPLPEWSVVRKSLKRTLLAFRDNPNRTPRDIDVLPGLELRLFRGGPTHPTFFLFGGFTDHDAGGYLISEIIRNVAICVTDKSQKVAPMRLRYPEWWLLLVDYIGRGSLESEDYAQLRAHLPRPEGWDRLIIVDPSRPTTGLEI